MDNGYLILLFCHLYFNGQVSISSERGLAIKRWIRPTFFKLYFVYFSFVALVLTFFVYIWFIFFLFVSGSDLTPLRSILAPCKEGCCWQFHWGHPSASKVGSLSQSFSKQRKQLRLKNINQNSYLAYIYI